MSSTIHLRIFALSLLGFLAVGGRAWAQDTQEPPTEPSKPRPAARGIPGVDDTTDENSQVDQWQPDNTPLTGLADPTLGSPELRHSYWVPGIAYGATVQSEPTGSTQSWIVNNYVGATVSLLEASGRNQIGLNYTGGGFFTTSNFESNGGFQLLTLADTITLNRWQIEFFDKFSYLPTSEFGFFGGTGIGLPGVSGSFGVSIPGLNSGLVPTQSVFSASGPRYSNATAAQVTYALSRRGSLTVGGAYGLLRFTQPGNVDNSMALGSVGYNYALTKEDSIGIFYEFAGYHYSGQPQALGTNIVAGAYSRKLTRKLALSLHGGPQFSHYRVPIGTQTKSTNVAVGATLSYAATQQLGITGTFFHGLSGGAGVLVGSLSDTATLRLTHRFGRVWNASFDFGYARNSPLGSAPGLTSSTFNDWFVGGGVSRPFGRNINFFANYTAYIESAGAAACVTTPCNTNYTQNTINLSIQWHTRPFVLE